MNEYTTKDPVLREKLEKIIDEFNNHIERTSLVYARRTGHKVKKDNNEPETPETPEIPDTPDAPETPDTPEPPAPSGPSHFAMVNQRFYGNHSSGNATHMSAEAVEAEAFAAALNPAAEGATLRMYTGYENYFTDFPIESLLVTIDGGSPVPGLVITTPNAGTAFFPQIPDRPEEAVEIIKDGQILATIAGVIRPSSVGEG
jgi:hypothetical protein